MFRAGRVAALLAACACALHGQGRGQADVALQGYYLGGSSQRLIDTTGMAVHFQSLLPGWGILAGSLEGYGADNRLRTGENFLELRGAPWMGQHWTVTGGDFHAPASLLEFPFTNLFTPEITARGFRVQSAHGDNQFTVFGGQETLMAGPRVPYRVPVPQVVMGASVKRRIGKSLQVGARVLQFSSSPSGMAANPYLFPIGRDWTKVRTFSVQALYNPAKSLKVYVEVSKPKALAPLEIPSIVAGAMWESPVVSVRANYVRQGVLYFPIVGYFAGDRAGPYAEIRFHPWKRLELSASANKYRNNLERNPDLPSLTSGGTSGSVTGLLPWGFSASAQISTLRFTSVGAGQEAVASNNRQLSAGLSKSLRNQTLHATWRDIRMDSTQGRQRQRSTELEDTLQIKRLSLGGAVRFQQSSGSEHRNSLYYRVSAQGGAGRMSIFANVEIGNDLANRTIFATNAYSTTVVGLGMRLFAQWNLQAEAFRNRLNMELNPESIFVLESGGIPVSQSLADLAQWSFFFRMTKQVRWGGGLPQESLHGMGAAGIPLLGTVSGVVKSKRLDGEFPAPGIPVALDGGRTAMTGPDGMYTFAGVPEGDHEIALSTTELPAEYDPGPTNRVRVEVRPRKISEVNLNVLPLGFIEGTVKGPEGVPLDAIVIRLTPGERYTTARSDGHFTFYNVREGDYVVALDVATLPDNAGTNALTKVPVAFRIGASVPATEFSFSVAQTAKPIKKVLDRK